MALPAFDDQFEIPTFLSVMAARSRILSRSPPFRHPLSPPPFATPFRHPLSPPPFATPPLNDLLLEFVQSGLSLGVLSLLQQLVGLCSHTATKPLPLLDATILTLQGPGPCKGVGPRGVPSIHLRSLPGILEFSSNIDPLVGSMLVGLPTIHGLVHFPLAYTARGDRS